MNEPAANPIQSVLLLCALVALLLVLRWLLWRALRWLGVAWTHGPALLKRGVVLARGDRVGRWFRARHPRLYRVLARRTDPRVFSGLPLTLLACAGVYVLFLFGGLVEDVLESEGIRTADEMIFSWVAPWRTQTLVDIFEWITNLGSMETLTAVAIVASAFLLANGPQRYVLPIWLTVIGSQVTTYSGKFIIARPRPEFLLDVTAVTPSFPSGHTTGAMAVYGIIAYAVLRDVKSPRVRFDIAFAAAVLVLLVAFSRIFLSVHFPSDVAAGLLVGGFWLLAGIALAEIRRGRGVDYREPDEAAAADAAREGNPSVQRRRGGAPVTPPPEDAVSPGRGSR